MDVTLFVTRSEYMHTEFEQCPRQTAQVALNTPSLSPLNARYAFPGFAYAHVLFISLTPCLSDDAQTFPSKEGKRRRL